MAAIPREYLVPMYSQTEVAQIVGATTSTVQRWVTGYRDGRDFEHAPLVESARRGRGYTVPFIGLAEVFVLNAFRKAGLPLQRIRPAVDVLKREIGLEHALANNQLLTDGAEILLDTHDPDDRRLLVVRKNGQAVFNEVVSDYLQSMTFGEVGYAAALSLPQYPSLAVRVDPRLNGGRPSVVSAGVAVDDVLSRVRAGEAPEVVADDFGISRADVLNLNRLAA